MNLLRKTVIRVSKGIALFLSIIILAALSYEQVNRVLANKRFPPEGDTINVDGHRLHYIRKGVGGPSVVFESGLDPYGHLSWFKIEKEIENLTTTISYDRAGILWSERGESPKTIQGRFNSEVHNSTAVGKEVSCL